MGDYQNSCHEFIKYVQAPQPNVGGKDWRQQFTQMSALLVWLYALIGIVAIVEDVLNENSWGFDYVLKHFVIRLLVVYAVAHFGWFIVVKHGGCIHPIVCVLVGLLYISGGLKYVKFAIHDDDLVEAIAYGLYGACLLFLGVAAVMIFASGVRASAREPADLEQNYIKIIG